ncbi:MAG TPA: glycosyltransferase [Acidimicrobiales bacterium]|nr:glycosyltransferase [Acidimicrobiales bacterium]
MRVDQYLPDLAVHDAIGNHVLLVDEALREAGYGTRIWAERIHPALLSRASPFAEDRPGGEDRLLVYHCSTGSEMASALAKRANNGERLLLYYYNITPARYFMRWDRKTALALGLARAELATLAPDVELAMAISSFNQRELTSAGYARTALCPLLVDLGAYGRPPNEKTLARLRKRRKGSGAQWLFVGRLAPNKCQHDVIGAFAAYRHLWDPRARLALVGRTSSERYRWALERLAHRLGLGDSLEIIDSLESDDALAYWAVADVFVCLSEHEGFCVPLLEAMTLGVPVVAYSATAVPETLGGAGILLDHKGPEEVALAVREVCRPGGRREELVAAGKARAADFSLERSTAALLGVLAAL